MNLFGAGVFKGMMVTLKNFLFSYFKDGENGGLITVQYPEQREKEIENFRNLPFLIYDESPENLRCVACGICERECPPKCIHIEMAKTADGKPARKPAEFTIDQGLCMNCGVCEDVCPFDSIFMDRVFEIATPDRQANLVADKTALAKSASYFQKIRPVRAAEIDAKRKAAEEKKKAAQTVAKPSEPAK